MVLHNFCFQYSVIYVVDCRADVKDCKTIFCQRKKMNLIKSAIIITLIGGLGFSIFNSPVPYEKREAVILEGVIRYIEQIHVSPKPIDDVFSAEVFDTYLDRIDGGKRFLTAQERTALAADRLLIDDEVLARKLDFFDKSLVLLEAGVERSEKIFSTIKSQELDYTVDDFIELDYDEKEAADGEVGLVNEWRHYFKYDVLTNYNSLVNSQEQEVTNWEEATAAEREEKNMEEPKVKSKQELLAEARTESIEDIEEWFERMNKLRRSDRFETYLGAITNYYDPHTSYFNPKEKQDFDINMGGKLEGIGARLMTDGDFTKVTDVIPGGPAYKSKEIDSDDLILEVAQEGEEPVDLTGMRIDDVVQHIRGKKGTIVALTIKKADGTVKQVKIERDEVIIDESFARSALLDIPDVVGNIGYIRLPKFYSSFENEGGNSCAADVAKELEKLKAENVNGIILDLRNNTGGSLNDVVTMSGLFYGEGPVVQVKPRERKAYVHKDDDSTVQYDGPLIIMVNQNSASASEILAAALQDYGRAVIVGSTSTFGKGTVQRFFDLDRGISGDSDIKPLGNLKISVQKFYRVNGGSTQLNGVNSDIVLPDSYHFIERGEKEYENALEWDEIEAKEYSQNVVQLKHMDELKRNSQKRLEGNADFGLILENAKRLKDNRDFSKFPLNIDKYMNLMAERKAEGEKYASIMKEDLPNLKIANLTADIDYINSDESKQARNEEWMKRLKKDIYIEETLHIIRDMITLEDAYAAIEQRILTDQKTIRP